MRAAYEAEFASFVSSASPGLLRTAWLLTGDKASAEDLVQEALVRLYPKWRRVSGGQPLAYARRIMVNLNKDRWRKEGGVRHTSAEVLDALPADDGPQRTSDQRDELTRLLRRLPPREREVLVLRHYVDLPEKDVADLLGISVGTVKSTAAHGLSTLRNLMAVSGEAS